MTLFIGKQSGKPVMTMGTSISTPTNIFNSTLPYLRVIEFGGYTGNIVPRTTAGIIHGSLNPGRMFSQVVRFSLPSDVTFALASKKPALLILGDKASGLHTCTHRYLIPPGASNHCSKGVFLNVGGAGATITPAGHALAYTNVSQAMFGSGDIRQYFSSASGNQSGIFDPVKGFNHTWDTSTDLLDTSSRVDFPYNPSFGFSDLGVNNLFLYVLIIEGLIVDTDGSISLNPYNTGNTKDIFLGRSSGVCKLRIGGIDFLSDQYRFLVFNNNAFNNDRLGGGFLTTLPSMRYSSAYTSSADTLRSEWRYKALPEGPDTSTLLRTNTFARCAGVPSLPGVSWDGNKLTNNTSKFCGYRGYYLQADNSSLTMRAPEGFGILGSDSLANQGLTINGQIPSVSIGGTEVIGPTFKYLYNPTPASGTINYTGETLSLSNSSGTQLSEVTLGSWSLSNPITTSCIVYTVTRPSIKGDFWWWYRYSGTTQYDKAIDAVPMFGSLAQGDSWSSSVHASIFSIQSGQIVPLIGGSDSVLRSSNTLGNLIRESVWEVYFIRVGSTIELRRRFKGYSLVGGGSNGVDLWSGGIVPGFSISFLELT